METQRTTPQQLPVERRRSTDKWAMIKLNAARTWRAIFEVIVIVGLVAILGSMNQLYKAINTLTEFNANALTKPQIYQGSAPNTTNTPASPQKK